MLAARAPELVGRLLPDGRREGHEWVHASLNGTSRRSLSVHLTGRKAGVWSDFASGDAGDALDLVAAVVCAGKLRDAIAWARAWLGLADGPAPSEQRRPPPPAPDPAEAARAEAATRGAAIKLFLAGAETLAGTPVAAYLAGRGIDLAELTRQPRSLRYHPALWNRESHRHWPAMLAGITDAAGDMVAVHRTWLALAEDGRWRKAPLQDPKMSLGRLAGGAVRLWRGASGKPLARAPHDETVAIGEGIETALSVVMACPELRVLYAVSLANMANVVLPPAVHTVILLKDEDGANVATTRAFARAIDAFQTQGRSVRVARPPVGKDFNDALLAEAV
ncbi:DUF7146 domain-containing protein [Rhodopila sp.]|uniref:DUF7146 domain-containing protein n=1 Tax=Rhodopila sp. TaxID=2480087 RepID=UPI003D10BD07